MKLIAGLGNPGKKYESTPHNAGFQVVDELARRWGCEFRLSQRFESRIAETSDGADRVLLVQPQTFMNASGPAVVKLMRMKGVGPEGLVVVLDDADLEFGRLRLRPAGRSGGHRGLASVIDAVGTDGFARIRVGVGRRGGNLVEHVLAAFSREEKEVLREAVSAAADAAQCVLERGIDAAMNRFNGFRAGPELEPGTVEDRKDNSEERT